jgi:hypothetical protein
VADLDQLLVEIAASAETARAGGAMPTGYESDLERTWERIAADLDGLRRGVEAGELGASQQYRAGGADPGASPPEGAGRGSSLSVKALGRRGVSKMRRLAGPRLRAAERYSVERAGRLAEEMATRSHALRDRTRRVAESGPLASRVARVSPRERSLPGAGRTISPRSSLLGDGSWELEDWIFDRLGQDPNGPVLHVECGDGNFVRRLSANGFDARGADPSLGASSSTVKRAGAFEELAGAPRASLGAVVLSGVTERVNAGSARALAHLAAGRLATGGLLVLVSAHPEAPGDSGDVLAAELADRRRLHPVTWCHLLARYGLSDISVHDESGRGYYAVTARRP